jgi:hypothetical protein
MSPLFPSPAYAALIWAAHFRDSDDDEVRRPMWEFPPEAREPLIHERRRRFGVDDDIDL